MLAESFSTIVMRAFTQPPQDDGDPNGWYAHAFLGRHAKFIGRAYRRGNTRCRYCGARMEANDGPPDPDRFLNARQRMQKNLASRNDLLARYMHRA